MTIRTVSYTVIKCDKCGKERKLEDFDRKDVDGWDLEKDECDECVAKRDKKVTCPECNKPIVGEFIFHNLETDKVVCEKCHEEGKDKRKMSPKGLEAYDTFSSRNSLLRREEENEEGYQSYYGCSPIIEDENKTKEVLSFLENSRAIDIAKNTGETKEEQEKNKKEVSENKENGSCQSIIIPPTTTNRAEEQKLPKFMNGLRKGKYKEEQIKEFLEEYHRCAAFLPVKEGDNAPDLWKFLGFLDEEEYKGWTRDGIPLVEILKKRGPSKKPWEKEGWIDREHMKKRLRMGKEARKKLKEMERKKKAKDDWITGWTKVIEKM